MRLNRYLSASGVTSRRKGESLIRDGRVTVNGVTINDPAFAVDIQNDAVVVDGKQTTVSPVKRYYVMNKPTGVIVSRGDTHGRPTVFDILDSGMRKVFSVGRLDADTSGVLLFTDDGDMAYRLTHPSYSVEKTYHAEVKGRISPEDIRKMKKGLVLDDGPASPAVMTILHSDIDSSHVEITVHEGRKRQVRRMFGFIGHPVITLERISHGGITVHNVPSGSFRPLSDDEVAALRKAVNLE